MANVKLDGVTKKFGSVTAINGLKLDIKSGELFVLLGPTGAGKTTTLRCVAGLERQEEGDILIDGVNVNRMDPAQRDVAFVFQYYSLYPHYSVRQNLEFPLKPKIRKIPQEEIGWFSLEGVILCTKMRQGEFGGFAVFITRSKIKYMGTGEWLMKQVEQYNGVLNG